MTEPHGAESSEANRLPNAGSSPLAAPPRFGAVEIVEAFTAMRHEWRNQAKENRELADQLQVAVRKLVELENQLPKTSEVDSPSGPATLNNDLKPWVNLATETDHQLSRAIQAITRSLEAAQIQHQQQQQQRLDSIKLYYQRLGLISRWFAKPLLDWIFSQWPSESSALSTAADHPATVGLQLVAQRLRRSLQDQEVERIDTEGSEFDSNTMRAIDSIASEVNRSGSVVEQIAPGYRWRGRVLKFAEVRVAK